MTKFKGQEEILFLLRLLHYVMYLKLEVLQEYKSTFLGVCFQIFHMNSKWVTFVTRWKPGFKTKMFHTPAALTQ